MKRCSFLAAVVLTLLPLGAHAGPKLKFPVKNVVFDIGMVLVGLNRDEWRSRMTPIAGDLKDPRFSALVDGFDAGRLSTKEFISGLRGLRPESRGLQDADIKAAWESQIGAADCEALRAVRAIRSDGFKTYALSTTDPLHVKIVEARMRGCFSDEKGDALAALFEKRYYTFEMGLLKPDPAIYEKMTADGEMDPRETLFLDDSPANVIGAQQAGLYSLSVPGIGEGPRYSSWLERLLKESR